MDDNALIQQLRTRQPAVLLVDDDLHITQGLKDILEDSGYAVQITHSGGEAERVLAAGTFSVLVVDYSLPDTNGIELARKLLSGYPYLKLILMTGHDRFDMQPHDMSSLFVAFLRKPVEVQAVTHAIEEAVHAQCRRLGLPLFEIRPSDLPAPVAPHSAQRRVQTNYPAAPSRPSYGAPFIVLFIAGFAGGWIAKSFMPDHHVAAHVRARVDPAPVTTPAPPFAYLPAPVLPKAEPPPRPMRIASSRKSRGRVTLVKAPPASVNSAPASAAPSTADYDARLTQADFSVRLVAAKALLKTNPDNAHAIEALLAMLQDADSGHRLAAVEALSIVRAATPATVSAMAARLADADPAVGFAAATVLGHMGPAAVPAIPQLTQALMAPIGQGGQSVGRASEDALVEIGKPGVPALIQKLDDPTLRKEVLLVLGRMGPDAVAALPAINSLTTDPSIGATALAVREKIQGAVGERRLSEKSTDASTSTKTAPL